MAGLVRVRANNWEFNVGAATAARDELTILDESAYSRSGRPRRPTRANGRPDKPRMSVDDLAAEKAASVAPESPAVTPTAAKAAASPADTPKEK